MVRSEVLRLLYAYGWKEESKLVNLLSYEEIQNTWLVSERIYMRWLEL
jgi:hypothetical protein